MRSSPLPLALVALAALSAAPSACGGAEQPAPSNGPSNGPAASGSAPGGATAPPPASAPTVAASGKPAPSAPPAAPSYEPKTPAEALALDLLAKRDAIGWSDKKKLIAYSTTTETKGAGFGLHVGFLDPKAGKDAEGWDACDPCDKLDAQLAKKVPELAKKLEGYAALKGAEVPAGKAADIPGSQLAVLFEGGKVMLGPAGAKPTKIAGTLKATAPHKPALERVWYLPEGKLVVGRVTLDPGDKYGEYNRFQQVRVFPVP